VPYLDLLQSWTQQDEGWICDRLQADGLHPNALGYRTILQAVQAWDSLMSAIQ
jgi:lysophospholipase L1-like esterase